jgi:hypothetical protein
MLDHLVETLLAVFGSIPALFLEHGSPHFYMVRAMLALIFVVGVFFVIALWNPRWTSRLLSVLGRKR